MQWGGLDNKELVRDNQWAHIQNDFDDRAFRNDELDWLRRHAWDEFQYCVISTKGQG